MPVSRHPFDRGKFYIFQKYDANDIVLENSSTTTSRKLFKDLPYKDQLKQNGWNFSTKTREDNHNDITVNKARAVSINERLRSPQRLSKYHNH